MAPLRVVVAPDKFKGTLTAAEVAAAMAAGCRDALPGCDVVEVPVADGGDGTVDALVAAGAERTSVRVRGPLGEAVVADLALLGGTAYVESAQACGLRHVPEPDAATAAAASTYGVGELVRAVLDRGIRRVVLGLGGSATTDGGAGMAVALGARLLDGAGHPLAPGGSALARLASVDTVGLDRRLRECDVVLASDVDSPLTGETGAAQVFARQKGADDATVLLLDHALQRYAQVLSGTLGVDVAGRPGAGAAGGLGAGAMAFLGARPGPGIDVVLDLLGLDDAIDGSTLVVVGEGQLDEQSLAGKAPVGVARRARAVGADVLAVAGRVAVDEGALGREGILLARSLVDRAGSLQAAVAGGPDLVRTVTADAVTEWASAFHGRRLDVR